MAIVLHPETFRELACFDPARVQEAGGMNGQMLEIIHDYACRQMGLDQGSAALVYLHDAPAGWIFFADREELPLIKGPSAPSTAPWTCCITVSWADTYLLTRSAPNSYTLSHPHKGAPRDEDHLEIGRILGTGLVQRRLLWCRLEHGYPAYSKVAR